MPALKTGLATLASADFPEKKSLSASLAQAINKLTDLQNESATAITQPKASRRAGLAQEYSQTATSLIELLDKISSQLTRSVRLEDAFVDQLMNLKQLAWVARNSAGDASVMISNGLGGQPMAPDTMLNTRQTLQS